MIRPRLGVNVDHVATLRQARGTRYPDPVEAALVAERAGADQITIHLREDRRHILDRDLEMMRRVVQSELNLEMAANQEMIAIALETRPDTVTIVPESREELTTEGGLDVVLQQESLKRVVQELQEGHIRVALFIDADLDQVRAAHKIDADAIEIHTGTYADARGFKDRTEELTRIRDAARLGTKLNLGVAAGHGLHYRNVIPVVRITEIVELNIGHSIVARAVIGGMAEAVTEMLALMREGRADLPRRR